MTDEFPVIAPQSCPTPAGEQETVLLAHGEGGRLMRQLLRQRVLPRFDCVLTHMDDAARLPNENRDLAITTDSFVVSPMFFPGGDIGSMAVYGTANDLAVSGAKPLYMTLSVILEEGLPLKVFDRVMERVAHAARRLEIKVVAGDTKVVPRGAADGMFLTTTGVGELGDSVPPGPSALREGDLLIVSGPVGRHGMAVLCAREALGLEPAPESDSAPLTRACGSLLENHRGDVKAMRDATRGGVAAVLHEWAEACQLTLRVDEKAVPVSADVRGACELLGLDPLHVANEGTMVIAAAADAANDLLNTLKSLSETAEAKVIGDVVPAVGTAVVVSDMLGGLRPLDEPLGAPLPRIC